MSGALDGLTVIALEQAVAAPLATSRLADAGARVIKLERPRGDFARHYDTHAEGSSSYFVWLNRNKESCKVDLGTEEDKALVSRMVSKADVFIQNLAPGATGRLGLDSHTLRQAYPHLITCDISGYAPATEYAERKAYDLMVQAESGLAAITGTESSGPSRVGVSICDIATGLTAHAQVLEALIARGITGHGRSISVALFDVAAEMMNIPYITARHGKSMTKRVGMAHPLIAPYGLYATKSGGVLVAVQSDHEWQSFCRHVLDAPHLINDKRFYSNAARVHNRAMLDREIDAAFQAHSLEVMVERLEVGRIAYGVISSVKDLLEHRALSTMGVNVDGKCIEMVAVPAIVDGMRNVGGVVPGLGAHDAAIRSEFSNVKQSD